VLTLIVEDVVMEGDTILHLYYRWMAGGAQPGRRMYRIATGRAAEYLQVAESIAEQVAVWTGLPTQVRDHWKGTADDHDDNLECAGSEGPEPR